MTSETNFMQKNRSGKIDATIGIGCRKIRRIFPQCFDDWSLTCLGSRSNPSSQQFPLLRKHFLGQILYILFRTGRKTSLVRWHSDLSHIFAILCHFDICKKLIARDSIIMRFLKQSVVHTISYGRRRSWNCRHVMASGQNLEFTTRLSSRVQDYVKYTRECFSNFWK